MTDHLVIAAAARRRVEAFLVRNDCHHAARRARRHVRAVLAL